MQPLVVPAGADCSIVDAYVLRGVTTEEGAGSLSIESSHVVGRVVSTAPSFQLIDTDVYGRVEQSAGTLPTVVCGSTVNGSALIARNAGTVSFGSTSFECAPNTVNGRLTLEGNRRVTTLASATVNGLLRVLGNTGPVLRSNVTVHGVLDCEGNTIAPPDRGGNTATVARGQCAPPAA